MYITLPVPASTTELSINDLLYNTPTTNTTVHNTHTFCKGANDKYWKQIYVKHYAPLAALIRSLADSAKRQFPNDSSEYYSTPFYIPKASGGYREINAPGPALMWFLKEITNTLQNRFQLLAHNNAYAYVQHRSVKDCAMQHKDNDWFLKLDLKHFFPSCTKQVILYQLNQIFPLNYMLEEYTDDWETIIDVALLHGQLPQGSPLSPLLSNLIMIPFDTHISRILKKKYGITYTRYADDIHLSASAPINANNIIALIEATLRMLHYPFKLNKEKTRVGSNKGKNWMLGVMLNKDHNITVGHRRKKRFKASIYNFIQDLTNNKIWDIIDVQVLLGEYSYIHNIEPETVDYIIKTYNTKYNIDVLKEIKKILA